MCNALCSGSNWRLSKSHPYQLLSVIERKCCYSDSDWENLIENEHCTNILSFHFTFFILFLFSMRSLWTWLLPNEITFRPWVKQRNGGKLPLCILVTLMTDSAVAQLNTSLTVIHLNLTSYHSANIIHHLQAKVPYYAVTVLNLK